MSLREGCRVSMWLVFISLTGFSPALSQTADFLGQDAAAVSVVRGAPFSAATVTTLSQTLGDGTRIERTLRERCFATAPAAYGASRRSSDLRRSIPTTMHSPSLRSLIRSLV